MVAEVVGGLITGSLALLADAGHTLSDVGALAVSILAIWIAQQPASARHTFGNTRAEILAALVQGVALVAVAIVIIVEAIGRLETPTEPGSMLPATDSVASVSSSPASQSGCGAYGGPTRQRLL
jgi:cobalt-zinc-cadmium efflux system protein